MSRRLPWIGRFLKDERGVFLPLFAVMAIVVVAMGGAVVDYVRIDSARTEAQIALDSTALALQPDIYSKSEATLKSEGQAFLTERIQDSSVTATLDNVETDIDTGTIFLHADITLPMTFLGLVGFQNMTVAVISQATRKRLKLEVAFALDNSGSMDDDNRMTNLKSATKCALNVLFYDACTLSGGETKNNNVKVSVIPFTSFVNVGAGNKNSGWIDTTGASSISADNFDDDDDESTPMTATVNRFDLFDEMGVSWRGCVQARPYPYDTNDTTPDASAPDTLFVPMFAPDEPDYPPYTVKIEGSWSNYTYGNSYLSDTPSNCRVYAGQCSITGNYTSYSYKLTYPDGTFDAGPHVCSCSYGGYPCSYYTGTNPSEREREQRLCKYDGHSPTTTAFGYGPNADCPTTALLPLTDSDSDAEDEVDAMTAEGGTGIQQGVIWAYRTLSPGVPFTQGDPYDSGTSKVMIVMTDGENYNIVTSNGINGTYFYDAHGFLYNEQLGTYGSETTTSYRTKMDTRTEESCTSAKNAGIEIYTIGLDPPNQRTIDMLTACATDSNHAYFPTDPSQLTSVFQEIAGQLADLRLAK